MIGTITFYPNYIWGAGFSEITEPSCSPVSYTNSGGDVDANVYDLVDARRTSVLTVETDGASTDFSIDIDLDSSIPSNFIIIDNHNLGAADADATFRYGAGNTGITSNNVYSGSLGSELTVMNLGGGTEYNITNDGILLELHDSLSSANFNVLIEDTNADNFNADVTLGEWYIGKSFSPSTGSEEPEILSNFDGIFVGISAGGQKESQKRYGERKAWRLKWPYISEADKDSFLTVWEKTDGPCYPFYIDLGEAAKPKLYFVRFLDNSLKINKLTANAYEISIQIESEV